MPLAPTLTIDQPPDDLVVQPNQPFLVTGHASERAGPEPFLIDSVTVQVDDQPAIDATLKHLPDRTSMLYAYRASAQVVGGQDPHTVAVTATSDQDVSTTRTVSIFTGPVFTVAAPAVLIDVSPFASEPDDPKVIAWLTKIQNQLRPLANVVASAGMLLAGPNVVKTTNEQGLPVLRFGLWIEDPGFPVVAPSLLFPLARLSDEAAAAGFDTVPLLPVPHGTLLSPAFALSVPTTTLQRILDAALPAAQAAASQGGATLKSLTVSTTPPATVTTTASGDLPLAFPFDGAAPFSITILEMLGRQQRPDPVAPEVMVNAPAIIGSTHWSSSGDAFDWFVSLLNPLIFVTLVYASTQVSDAADEAGKQFNGAAGPLLAALPSSIPFKNTELPELPIALPDFPAFVLDWESFGVAPSGILGTGTVAIEARDQSKVSTEIDGIAEVIGYQEELAGGAGQGYGFKLVDIAPDQGAFTWSISGTAAAHGSIDVSPFTQSGNFGAVFPLPLHVKVGTYPFTLETQATETCGSDPTKKLTASASVDVTVEVRPNPKVPK